MKEDKEPKSWLKKLLAANGETNKMGKFQYVALIVLFGAGIMIISNLFLSGPGTSTSSSVQGMDDGGRGEEEVETFGGKNQNMANPISEYESMYEGRLKEALEKIAGVSDVTVVVNVDSTEKQVLEKNTVTQSQVTDETDREGGTRKVEDKSKDEQVVIIRNGEKEVPIVLETKKPEIRGVLVVAKGADNIQVKKWIVESVTKLLDVPSHRVSVMPKK